MLLVLLKEAACTYVYCELLSFIYVVLLCVVTTKYLKFQKNPFICCRCWKNGDDTNKPNVVSLPTRYCHTVEDVLDLVSQVMQKNYVFGPVSK